MSNINNGKYSAFSADIKSLIDKASRIYVTISSDEAGTNLVNDSNGNTISKKLIVSMKYSYPENGNLGNYTITFVDGSSISINDDNSDHWYVLETIEPYVYKQLV
jgi:hypothetical protein